MCFFRLVKISQTLLTDWKNSARIPRFAGLRLAVGKKISRGTTAVSSVWRSTRKFIYKRILHADDTPHRIAFGVAIAVFIGFTPTMGLQTVIALGLAALLGANKAVTLPFVWITNPFTFGPIYWGCWRFGTALTNSPSAAQAEEVMNKLHRYSDEGIGLLQGLFRYEFWVDLFNMMVEIGVELWVGCTIVGLVSGTVMYLATKWTVEAYRARRHDRIMRRHERRLRRQAARAARAVENTDRTLATGDTA